MAERITPEKALEKAKQEARGHLKIFIGYAPGVGKTFTMLQEGNRRKKYGQDVVIGYVEDHQRDETNDQIGTLEIMPRTKISYGTEGNFMEEMDTAAIIARAPFVALVDELAHTNAPGSKNKKRYEDVEELLEHGINVVSTLNIQHLESLNDVVMQITGVRVNETIPDYIVQRADEIVVVDLTPDALQNRLLRGNVYNVAKVPQALKNFFRKGSLSALRELALRQAAEEVDEELAEYMKNEGIRDNWRTAERIMVCIYPDKTAKKIIRSGARTAFRYKCPWYVVYLNYTGAFSRKTTKEEEDILEGQFKLARQLGAETEIIDTPDIAGTISEYANKNHISRIVIGYSKRVKFQAFVKGKTVGKLLRTVDSADILLVNVD